MGVYLCTQDVQTVLASAYLILAQFASCGWLLEAL